MSQKIRRTPKQKEKLYASILNRRADDNIKKTDKSYEALARHFSVSQRDIANAVKWDKAGRPSLAQIAAKKKAQKPKPKGQKVLAPLPPKTPQVVTRESVYKAADVLKYIFDNYQALRKGKIGKDIKQAQYLLELAKRSGHI